MARPEPKTVHRPHDVSANLHGRSAALDGLRAFAVMGVVLAHAGFTFHGPYGVPAFFVLSGYLITGILAREHARTGTVNFRRFYGHRVMRLAPALIVLFLVLAPWCLLYPPFFSFRAATAWSALYNAAMITNWAAAFPTWFPYPGLGLVPQTWTLGIEWQFYLLWPFGMVFALCRTTPHRLGVIVISAALVICIWKEWLWDIGLPEAYWTHATELNVDGLLFGAAAALCDRSATNRAVSTFAALASFAVTAFLVFNRFGHGYGVGLRVAVFEIATAVLILNLVGDGRTMIKAVFGSALVAYVGRISYSLYLWHLPVHFVMEGSQHFDMHDYPHLVPEVGLSITMAALSFHLVETPAIRMFKRLAVDAT